jgi:hypothetical protein
MVILGEFNSPVNPGWFKVLYSIDRHGVGDKAIGVSIAKRADGPKLWRGPVSLPQMAKKAGLYPIFPSEGDQSDLRLWPA